MIADWRPALSSIRWFYVLLIAGGVALITLGLERLLDLPKPLYLQAIIAAAVLVIIVSLLVLSSKHSD